MKFRAENFEAEVIAINAAPSFLGWYVSWVIIAQGHKPRSIRKIVAVDESADPAGIGLMRFQVLTDRGWVELFEFPGTDDKSCIADAIALLYSAPGVRHVEDE